MRVLIVGCGYVGLPLGALLVARGHQVFGLRRKPKGDSALTSAGVIPIAADITKFETLASVRPDYDWVINTVAASEGGVDQYRAVYLEGTRNLVRWLSLSFPKRFVYTSSTSVYGQCDGSLVEEISETRPASETAKVLLETEQFLLDSAAEKSFPASILRVAGIYGPERGYWLKQWLKGESKVEADSSRLINMIHRDDVIEAVVAALESGRAGEIYNAVDNEPVTVQLMFQWLSQQFGKEVPSFTGEPGGVERNRAVTNKRVSNRKLKTSLGYSFKYPTFREGFTAELQRLGKV